MVGGWRRTAWGPIDKRRKCVWVTVTMPECLRATGAHERWSGRVGVPVLQIVGRCLPWRSLRTAQAGTCPGLPGWLLAIGTDHNRNHSPPVDKSRQLAVLEAVLDGFKGDSLVTVHRPDDVRFFTESVDKYVNSVRESLEDPVFMRVWRGLPNF